MTPPVRLGVGPLADAKVIAALDLTSGLENERIVDAAGWSAEAGRRVAIGREIHR